MRRTHGELPSTLVGAQLSHGRRRRVWERCTHDHSCRFGGCEGDSHLMVSILSVRSDVGQLLRGRGEIVRFKENKDD